MSDTNPKNVLVNSPEWQRLRKSLLGTWKEDPVSSCEKLKKYLGPLHKTSNDKIRVVMNYLTGTGFRTGKINHPCISMLRSQMSSEIKIRKAKKKW
jgi:hypothetical protein